MQRQRMPFRGLTLNEWVNLSSVAIVVYYLAKLAMEVYFYGLFLFLRRRLSLFLECWLAGKPARLCGNLCSVSTSRNPILLYAQASQYQTVSSNTCPNVFSACLYVPFPAPGNDSNNSRIYPVDDAQSFWQHPLSPLFLSICFQLSASSHALTPAPFLAILSIAVLGSNWVNFIDSMWRVFTIFSACEALASWFLAGCFVD